METKLDNIQACVFDAYGTLFDVAASARRCSDEIGDRWLDFSAMWRKKQLEYTWLRSLMGEFKDFWHVTGDALDFTMETYNIYDPALRTRLMELYLKLDAYPEVPQMLKNLRDRGIKTAILSNGSRTMLTSAVRKAGIEHLLDGVFSVDELKVFKIHPSVYQFAVDELGVAKENISFQSANSWDAVGATAFGFQVVWVNRFGQKREKLDIQNEPKFEIRSLAKLPDLIGS
ncbi:haloacid dehalogenase type II [Terasakiella sp. A23]|uniref:haloacid dehalogenase type II n=1 Tax=Terasakiella sp. FCG-A23 TaxID=3080561 RepID=UPI0029559976|nr:haloacid dehalogenase type II [Terasakiella sp. A23]MDV7341449.1 haloacid dehalogenase type II [Terasakiella sp. A23]